MSEQSCQPLIAGITFYHNVWSNRSNKSLMVEMVQINCVKFICALANTKQADWGSVSAIFDWAGS